MIKTKKITVENTEISVILQPQSNDYISLTDMAKYKDNDPNAVVANWLRNRNTLEYLGVWEYLHNPNFNPLEFEGFKEQSGLNRFTISPKKWIERTNAIGIMSRSGRYGGGTYAHKDIAFNFGMWLSPTFQLYIVQEYQRLVEKENSPLSLQWDVKRLLSKTNYTLHTDAIKSVIIPRMNISKLKERIVYADEADMLNLALFGCTAKDWRDSNPELAKQGKNIRDCASINQLIVISNMESYNSIMIHQGVDKQTRKRILYKTAKSQLETLDKTNIEQQFRKIGQQEGNLPLLE